MSTPTPNRRRILIHAPLPANGGAVSLSTEQWHYLHRVLRLTSEDILEVRDGAGGAHDARISGNAQLELGPRFDVELAKGCRVRLCFAPSKGKRFDFLLEKASEIGAAELQPIITARGVRKPDGSALQRWNRISSEAARQSGAAHVPQVHVPVSFDEAVRSADGLAVLAHPAADRSLRDVIYGQPIDYLTILTGPEGGFTDAEVELATTAGVVLVALGDRILRAETAPIVALTLALEYASTLKK